MSKQEEKQKALKKLQPKVYRIYGIFNFKTKKLVCVSLDQDELELKFEIENYNDDYDIVSFDVALL